MGLSGRALGRGRRNEETRDAAEERLAALRLRMRDGAFESVSLSVSQALRNRVDFVGRDKRSAMLLARSCETVSKFGFLFTRMAFRQDGDFFRCHL